MNPAVTNYTLTDEAHRNLLSMFPHAPSKVTVWRRQAIPMVSDVGRIVYEAPTDQRTVGLSHSLTLLARSFDLHEWTPKPEPHPYAPPKTNPITSAQEPNLVWYNPYDTAYMNEVLNDPDPTPWLDIPQWERDQRQLEASRLRYRLSKPVTHYTNPANSSSPTQPICKHNANRHSLSLDKSTRRYYAALRQFFNIPLLPTATHPHSMTTHIATVLEAIGTHHLIPPPNYLAEIQAPNQRMARLLRTPLQAAKRSKATGAARRYGNHSGDAWIMHEWRSLPKLTKQDPDDPSLVTHPWTQEDVTWAATNGLLDLATEAVTLNPTNLSLPAGVKPYQPPVKPNTRTAIHIDLVLPAESSSASSSPSASLANLTYHYKGRDITALILQAHDLHYGQLPASPRVPFPALSYLAERFGVPLYTMRTLATREHVRRLMATS